MGEKVVGFIPNEDDGVGGRRRERHVAFVLWGHAFGLQHEHDLGVLADEIGLGCKEREFV
jgi:hypothetical protein